MSEPVVKGRRRSSKRANTTSRADALNRLSLSRCGRRSEGGYQVKIEDPIYDILEEDEYASLVQKRREEARGFIVDDDGLGYGDEGQEEDWSQAGLPSSSDGESDKTEKKKSEKKEPPSKRPNPLSATAKLMGKQRISSLFTSSVFKKSREEKAAKGLLSDSIVDDVIAEFAPDEADRERRRRGRHGSFSGTKSFESMVPTKSDNNLLVVNPEFTGIATIGDQVEIEEANNDMGFEKDGGMETTISEKRMLNSDVDFNQSHHEPVSTLTDKCMEVFEGSLKAKDDEVKVEQPVKGGEVFSLSTTAGQQFVRNGENGNAIYGGGGREPKSNHICDENSEFVLDSDGSLPFYIIDAHEELYGANSGTVYLFGKVKAGSTYHSCCAVVKNVQRCVYAIPNGSIFQNNVIMELEKEAADSQISSTEMASGLKNEITKKLLDLNVSTFSLAPVKRRFALEQSGIPVGEYYVLKVNYPFEDPPFPSDLKGEHFSALLGTHCSALELFLIKRNIKGPSWLSISKFAICPDPRRASWCKFEISVDCPKYVRIPSSSKVILEIPPVIVSSINLKTVVTEKQNVNEIVCASIICCRKAKIDTPVLASEWKRHGILSSWTVVRKLEGGIFPIEFMKEVPDRNTKDGNNVLLPASSERALLIHLMSKLHDLDSDILVGHNISGFDLDVLLHRLQVYKVPMWSKVGRLKRSMMPKITKTNTIYGSGVSPGIMSCIAGRLLCDTYLCSRDLLKEVSYSLTQLAKTQLNKDRKEIAPHDIPKMFQASGSPMELIEYCETDAWLSLELMFHLSILPLTRQLTNISGNLWGKTLQGARAHRVEYLLLHAFHAKKYIVPDKISTLEKDTNSTKRRVAHSADDLDINGTTSETRTHKLDQGKGKKCPAYSGGLVLEPKRGLYDKYILLMDFNSLYPSIIQEYNICFTTVERSEDGSICQLPFCKHFGVLPEILRNLVERRRMVKSWMKAASGLKAQQLDIQQQALKLTANSVYGCLGFSNSRFYAKPLAELITLQGREILQSTVDLVQNNLKLEVIYGDTDSIMIYTGLEEIAQAKAIARKVIQEVNKKYRCLEIDLDGLYKRMLLLQKKKYAAVKVQFKDGIPFEVIERKGLDMVRRDWSLLSKELGDFCLSQILSGGSCEDVVESIHSSLMKVQEEMRNGEVALEKYVITKTLTKPTEAYPDAKNQPHVQVALRLKDAGYSHGCSAGDTVPYIICCEQGTSSGSSTGFAHRARHPDELKGNKGNWIIDIDYYLAHQIHPVVSRLCASIQGTSPARLADCLGLDSSKFQAKSIEASSNNSSSASLLSPTDDVERYEDCEPLRLSCPNCSGTFECPPVSSFLLKLASSSTRENPIEAQAGEKESDSNFWCKLRCLKCSDEGDRCPISPSMIANQAPVGMVGKFSSSNRTFKCKLDLLWWGLLWLACSELQIYPAQKDAEFFRSPLDPFHVKSQVDGFISKYYKCLMMCNDETCNYTTRSLNLRVIGDSERGTVCPNYPRCTGHLLRKYTEADLYKQLTYFCHLFDVVRFVDKLDLKVRIPMEKEVARIRSVVDLAASTVQKIRDRCSYGWVKMEDLAVIL